MSATWNTMIDDAGLLRMSIPVTIATDGRVYLTHRPDAERLCLAMIGCTLHSLAAETHPSYRPTIRVQSDQTRDPWRILGDEYDRLQAARGDARRCWPDRLPRLEPARCARCGALLPLHGPRLCRCTLPAGD